MPAANVANLSLVTASDPTGHGQPTVELIYTDVEGLFGDPGIVYPSAVYFYQHGGQKIAEDINNTPEPSKVVFEMFASPQSINAGKILVRQ